MTTPGTSADGPLRSHDFTGFGSIVLRGLGQVMFQENAVTGLLFLVGMALTSWRMALAALMGAVVGPLVARLCRFDGATIDQGIYGYNPALVGAAALFFLPSTPLTWLFAAAGAALAVPLTWLLARVLPVPAYTSAFVLTAWGLLAAAGALGDRPPAPAASAAAAVDAGPRWERFVSRVASGVAEVMFGSSALTGACFVAGLAVGSWRHAVVAVAGAAIGTLVAIYHGDPGQTLDLGIYGYNAALAALAAWLARPSWLAVVVAAAASVPLVEFFPVVAGFPALTAPFIMAAWIVLAMLALDRGTQACT